MNKKYFFLIAILSLFTTYAAHGQTTELADSAIKKIPATGRSLENFVPKGWEIAGQANGDLNGDGIVDSTLSLAIPYERWEKLNANASGFELDSVGAPNIVVVLFGTQTGYKRFAVNGHLFLEPPDRRSMISPTIKNGVLILNNNWGDIWATDATFRFRFDKARDKLVLIGLDYEYYARANSTEGTKTSENYLTGQQISYEKNGRSYSYSETGRKRIPLSKITFEEAVLNDRGDVVKMR